MKIRVKFFLIFTIIAVFTLSISYYLASISIRKIVYGQTEQTLSSSLYTNYSLVKNLIEKLPTELTIEVKVRDLMISMENMYELEKNGEEIFSSLSLDYFLIKKGENIIFAKANFKNIDRNINFFNLEYQKISAFMTDYGLLFLTKISDNRIPDITIIGGKLINTRFLEKMYQENVNVVFYWNSEVFLSTNPLFQEPILAINDLISQNNDEFKPSETILLNWEDRAYKLKFHPVIYTPEGKLLIATMSSTLFEDKVFSETRSNMAILMGIFMLMLLVFSYFISKDIMEPFYELAIGIAKKDKKSIRTLLTRKDEIGNLANEFWNITEDLLKQQEQKEKVNSLITHDLKTPLVAITRTLETLRDKESLSIEQRAFYLNMMIKHCNQSLELINNLLKVQKYELGKMNLFMSEENFNELADECINGLKPISEQKEIRIESFFDRRITNIMLDRTEMLRVINNLLSNAIKYTDDKGNIRVSSRLLNDSIELRITDDGKGIPIYEQKKIFNFYKTSHDNPETKDEQDISTGLGLYLCKQIIQAHGGQIGFESYKNKGSSFYFSIPLR